jgi:3-hydroxyacyl-[acyl-carrier-protein] dehydratase
MLLGDFYKIVDLKNEGENLNVIVQFNAAHQIFTGHLPTLPVVPGVCQTQMLNEILNYTLGKNLFMTRAGQIKFLNLLNPVKTPQIQIDIKLTPQHEGKFLVQANYFWHDMAYFRFKGEFQ